MWTEFFQYAGIGICLAALFDAMGAFIFPKPLRQLMKGD